MMSIRHAIKLLNASKLNLLPSSSQISIIRLSSSSCGSKFLQQLNRNQLHIIRTLKTRNTSGTTSSSYQQRINALGNLILQKIDSISLKKLGIFLSVPICSIFIMRYFEAPSNPTVVKALEAEAIEFDEFLTHIVPTGEVLSITCYPKKQRIIGYLYPGALINGKSYTNDVIPIKVERGSSSQLDQIRQEIRNAEDGLPRRRERIYIEVYNGAPLLKKIYFALNLVFIASWFPLIFKWIRRIF